MERVALVAGVRTPIGKYGGALRRVPVSTLGSLVLTQLIPNHPRPSFETRLNSQQLT